MNAFGQVPLADICTIVGGGTPRRSNAAYYDGTIPWATPTDVTKLDSLFVERTKETITEVGLNESSARLVPAGTVLMTSRATIGYTAIATRSMATNQGFANLICGESVVPEYLAYCLRDQRDRLIQLAGGTTFKELPKSTLKKVRIPLPTLEEQRRIVAILNQAAKTERLRKQAQQRLQEFIPALFIKMFGDPVDNPMGWGEKSLGMLGKLDRGRSRHRPRNAKELYGGSYPFVQTGDVANSDGLVRNASQTYSEFGLSQSKLWPAGTLCITIAANIGKTGILEFDACFPDSIVGFTPNETVTVEYIQTALDLMQKRIEETAPMAAQRNINLRTLDGLKIPVPSIQLQRQFTEIVKSARTASAFETNLSDIGVKLVDSLMTRLLRGPEASQIQ